MKRAQIMSGGGRKHLSFQNYDPVYSCCGSLDSTTSKSVRATTKEGKLPVGRKRKITSEEEKKKLFGGLEGARSRTSDGGISTAVDSGVYNSSAVITKCLSNVSPVACSSSAFKLIFSGRIKRIVDWYPI